jgi:hypothetical protein
MSVQDKVKSIIAQVVGEAGVVGDLVAFDTQLLGDDALDLILYGHDLVFLLVGSVGTNPGLYLAQRVVGSLFAAAKRPPRSIPVITYTNRRTR